MSILSAASAKVQENRVAYSLLFQTLETIQARYATDTEDPTTVTSALLQNLIAEFDVFRSEYNTFIATVRATTDQIRDLPDNNFKTALTAEQQQFVAQINLTIDNTIVPFRNVLRSEAARLSRDEAAAVEAEKTARAEDIVDYRAEQNSDGSGPGDTGTWYVIGANGEVDSSGLTEQAARLRAEDLSFGDADADLTTDRPEDQPDFDRFRAVFNDGTGPGNEGTYYVLGPGGQTSFSRNQSLGEAEAEAARLNAERDREEAEAAAEAAITPEQREADRVAALTAQLREQASRAQQRKQANEGDWRVKLRLAESADYLYRDPDLREDGLLWPLAVTNGVIFPYTPAITTSYTANYADQALTHSNYKGYFYQSSSVGQISISATFTAQDTSEANYMLAVIHFFRSATKMFYGQDAQRGAPPPLVFLQGLGEMQFNLHPCVINSFDYTLPADVDYIRARTANIPGNGDNLLFRRSRNSNPSSIDPSSSRLESAGLAKGARTPLSPGLSTTLGRGTAAQGPSYVPTKMEILLTLLPIQTRLQQSQEFSVRQFANGSLQKGGFW